MEKAELTTVVKELDDMAMRMLQLMKEYIDVKSTLEELIKSGSLHLAKSRYIMGNRSVSALQLPSEDSNEFTALVKVLSVKDPNDEVIFDLNRLSLSDLSKDVKSRQPKVKGESEETNNLDKNIQDPLKWFGVLVPQNMRQAQSSFSKALEYVLQGTNLQLEMMRLKVNYDIKLKKKKELLDLNI
ncbi:coiled-coil domain-containing protein 115 [Halyomorpha halys]|uniref:coiled-coil domain-containing protein 115 n=1 Tax=Halyomorpha halys TaxID=286706 RepID=UPI0006D4D23E|nr:coiled-coil domain-containing protein 115 [Halyomorpha halys]